MNQITNKNKGHEMPEDLSDKALRLYDEGKPVSDILVLFPEHKEELSRIFAAIDILEEQKEAVSAPKELLAKIVSGVSLENFDVENKENASAAGVTIIKDNRYSSENDYAKGRFSPVKIFGILKLFTMEKMYIGAFVFLLLAVTVAGISYRQSHKKGNAVVANLPVEEINKLSEDQEALSRDVAILKEISADDESLSDINQDLADISGEQDGANGSFNNSKINKTTDVAYLETLESGLGSEIANFSSDSQDLEGINSDMSLTTLDSELSGI